MPAVSHAKLVWRSLSLRKYLTGFVTMRQLPFDANIYHLMTETFIAEYIEVSSA